MTSKSVTFPKIDSEIWAQQYDLSLEPHPCNNCGRLNFPTIPFATGSWRGLMSTVHECGEMYRLHRAREIDDSNSWQAIFKFLKSLK